MELYTIALGVFFLVFVYLLIDSFQNQQNMKDYVGLESSGSVPTPPGQKMSGNDRTAVSEVVYTQDYYPWWRSSRATNVDGWLYQKPYYNYWRRPYYYNYWYAGRPLIIGGKRHYRRRYW